MPQPAPVLVVTRIDDSTADLVLGELRERDVPVARFDPGADFPGQAKLAASADEGGLRGSIVTRTRSLDLARIRSVYWRQPTPYTAPGQLDTMTGRWVADQSRFGLGGVLAALPGARYLNHPWRNRDAEYKPAQLATAAACGLAIPRTLMTNDLTDTRTFASANAVVYKPFWSTPYRSLDGVAQTVWTDTVEPGALDERVEAAAHLFQVRVDKNLDAFRLVFGAFDFALTGKGEWVFLECNPNGQWGWFGGAISQGIAAAIADHLTRPEGSP